MLMHSRQGKEECSNNTQIPAFRLPRMVEVQTRSRVQAWIPDIQDPAEYVGHPYTVIGPRRACCILFNKGECEKGAKCPFRHEKPAISRHEIMDLAADTIQASEEGLKSGVNQKQHVHDLAEKLNSNL